MLLSETGKYSHVGSRGGTKTLDLMIEPIQVEVMTSVAKREVSLKGTEVLGTHDP